jgi:predicted nucleic acid-binding protein
MLASGRFLLDTNIVIALLEGDEAVVSNLDLAPDVDPPSPVILTWRARMDA